MLPYAPGKHKNLMTNNEILTCDEREVATNPNVLKHNLIDCTLFQLLECISISRAAPTNTWVSTYVGNLRAKAPRRISPDCEGVAKIPKVLLETLHTVPHFRIPITCVVPWIIWIKKKLSTTLSN